VRSDNLALRQAVLVVYCCVFFNGSLMETVNTFFNKPYRIFNRYIFILIQSTVHVTSAD